MVTWEADPMGSRSDQQTFAIDEADARRWLDLYFEMWRTSDPELGASLFTEDATYTETPWEERWPAGARMENRDEIRDYLRHVIVDWSDFIDGGYVLWAVNGAKAFGRLWADMHAKAEGYCVPVAHAFEATFVPDANGGPICRAWHEWKPEPPEHLYRRDSHAPQSP